MEKLILYNETLARGGAEHVMVYLAGHFVRSGVPCEIVTNRIAEKEYPVPEGVRRISVPEKTGYIRTILKLRKIFKKSGADTILAMGTSLCLYVIPACFGLKIRVVISERNDPAHFDGKKIVKIISQFLMRAADDYVFQTEDAKKYYSKSLKNRGTVIFNPLFTENLPEICSTGERTKLIAAIGRLTPQKNQNMLLDAFAKIAEDYPEYNLVIYGEGKLRNSLQEKINSLHLENRVSMPGNVPDVLERIKDAAVFVLSSDFEGMPNALIEAMALGMPCISTDCPCGGPRELIKNGENGLLTPVGDAAAMEAALRKMLDNPADAAAMGLEATKIRQKLNMDKIGEQWLTYLKNI